MLTAFSLLPLLAPTAPAVGAELLDRSRAVVRVNPNGPVKTLKSGFAAALKHLDEGTPTRVEIAAGTYREAIDDIDWTKGKRAQTPLFIVGKGAVVITGADIVPASAWRDEGNGLKSAAWTHKFGNSGYQWSAKGIIGHRREMAFQGGKALRPRILEPYTVGNAVQTPDAVGQITYTPGAARDPATVLQPGEFGVKEGESRIYVRPLPGQTGAIEVSTRRILLNMTGKSNFALVGLTLTAAANDESDFSTRNALTVGDNSDNVLIDRCQFLWNANTGLHIRGTRWTLRNSKFNFNGGSGIASGKSKSILFEDCETNFNVWRTWWAGEVLYYTGGVKMHEVTDHVVRRHLAMGNATAGLWWDIQCHNVTLEDSVLFENSTNHQFEISPGPFTARRVISAKSRYGTVMHYWAANRVLVEDSILWNNYAGTEYTSLFDIRWFNRDDSHAAGGLLRPESMVVRRSVFVSGGKITNFGQMEDERNPARSDYAKLTYLGEDNTFFHPNNPQFSRKWDRDRGKEINQFTVPIQTFLTGGGYEERNPRDVDPRFVDPVNGDFRLAADSPLRGRRHRLPVWSLSPELRRTADAYYAWSGFEPTWWKAPPNE